MTIRRQYLLVSRSIAVLMPGFLGWLLYRTAGWLVHHDSMNYGLRDAGLGVIGNAAEIAFTFGPVPPVVAGLVLGLPSVVGYTRQVVSVLGVAALNALACPTLLCALGSGGPLPLIGLLGTTALLWMLALVWAAIRPRQTGQAHALDGRIPFLFHFVPYWRRAAQRPVR
jgi:hypothetical protein